MKITLTNPMLAEMVLLTSGSAKVFINGDINREEALIVLNKMKDDLSGDEVFDISKGKRYDVNVLLDRIHIVIDFIKGFPDELIRS
jgi:hypothetical protein